MEPQPSTSPATAEGLPPVPLTLHQTMPTINGEAVPSLSTCSTNLHSSCDFLTTQKYLHYLYEWRHPAPKHCQPRGTTPASKIVPPLTPDRLGINIERNCDLR